MLILFLSRGVETASSNIMVETKSKSSNNKLLLISSVRNRLDEDELVDMRKLESITLVNDVISEGKKAQLLGDDVCEIVDDWKKVLSSCSFLINEFPTIIDSIHSTESIVSDFTSLVSGNIINAGIDLFNGIRSEEDKQQVLLLTDIRHVYNSRTKYSHSIIVIERWAKNIMYVVKEGIEFCHKHDEKVKEKAGKVNGSQSLVHRLLRISKKKDRHQPHETSSSLTTSTTTTNNKNSDPKAPPSSSSEVAVAVTATTASTTTAVVVTDVTHHISIKAESEKIMSCIHDDVKSLVTDGEDVDKFVSSNVKTIAVLAADIETIKNDWKGALQSIGYIQSIIPLVNEAIASVEGIANLIRDSFGAATLNPSSFIALMQDGKQVFDDVHALYEIDKQIGAVLERVAILSAFLLAATGIIIKGRTLVLSYQSITNSSTTTNTTTGEEEKCEPALVDIHRGKRDRQAAK